MTTAFTIWMVFGVLVLIVWAWRHVVLGRILRRRKVLRSDSYAGPPILAPRVSVVVAAKDEEGNIESCVTTLLEQDYPNFEVIAVNDRSADRTGEILGGIERRADGRLRVLTVDSIREGWFGKNNAMREGVEQATGDWFLFTDADCRQVSYRTISMAMREVLTKDVDFLSVLPVLETKTVWERVTQPVCALVLMVWFLPSRVNNVNRKTAYANGAFMLMSRRCYLSIGGHERVRTEVNEDIHMARVAKGSGWRLKVMENEDLFRTRMYRSAGESWCGWSRIFYGSLGSTMRLVLACLTVILFGLLPWVSVIVAVGGWLIVGDEGANPWAWSFFLWGATVCLLQLMMWRLYPVFKISRGWSLAYVGGAVVALGMLVNAMLKVLGATRTTWRGTHYRRHAVEATTSAGGARVSNAMASPANPVPAEEIVADG